MGTHTVNSESVPRLKERLVGGGFGVYDLDGSTIHDTSSFFEAVVRDLPMGDACLDPAPDADWRFPDNWSAFIDFLWQGLASAEHRRVAILWMDAGHLRKCNPGLYHDALECLATVARDVRVPTDLKNGTSVVLHLFLVNGYSRD